MIYIRCPELSPYQGIFKPFRDREEFATGDLYEKHPTKSHRWRAISRQDDLIVLTNGEKFQPRAIEEIISSHKRVKEALVVGRERF